MIANDSKNVEIKLGGDLQEIDVDLLIASLISYSIVTQDTAAYLSPGVKVDIKIKAPKRGSFIIALKLLAEHGTSLFTRENLTLAAEILTVVSSLYALRKWFAENGKADSIKQIDENKIELTSIKGNIHINQNVYNIYQENPRIRENLRKTFDSLKDRDEITDFTIRDADNDEDLFSVNKEDFPSLASSVDEVEQKKQKVIKQNQELSIFKVVFKEDYKWEFYYQGIKIFASIKDKHFYESIANGEVAFRSGDKLIVELEIIQIFNESANTFVNDAYGILKVNEHIERISSSQQSIGFNDENES